MGRILREDPEGFFRSARRSVLTALRFVIYVSWERVAEATLWLDPDSGLPVRREQVVAFPGGSMRVIESYDLTMDLSDRSRGPTMMMGPGRLAVLVLAGVCWRMPTPTYE
jgi:hypothetical protein